MTTPVQKTVLIMAGGTGGHVFPALATAEVLMSKGCAVEWLGTRQGIEAEIVTARNIPVSYISAVGVRGKNIGKLLKAPFLLLQALLESIRVIRRLQPVSVLGMGGYVAGPGGLAAWLLRKPLVIHEQNAIAGTTNRILRKIARRVLQGFPGVFPDGLHVGNPVRTAIADMATIKREVVTGRRINLLVVGGSQGAAALNETVPQAIAALDVGLRPQVRHQTGKKQEQQTRDSYAALGVDAQVDAFIHAMPDAYQWADLVVCRSGAMTVSELACAGLPAIFVPFPHAIDDHQTANARWLEQAGACVILPQHQMTVATLAQVLRELIGDREKLALMSAHARACALPQAANTVADICLEVANG